MGDLLEVLVDCIVNAANGGFPHGGLAAAIAGAAGSRLEEERENITRPKAELP